MVHIMVLLLLNVPVQKVAPIKQRAVDYVSVRNKPALFGILLDHGGKRPTIVAVQREWLRTTQPEQFQLFRKQEIERETRLRKVLAGRIEKWIKERPEDADLLAYLREQQASLKVGERESKEPKVQFIIGSLEAKSVRRVQPSAGERRRPLWLAYRERLKNVETRSSESLMEELADKGVQIPEGPVDLSARIPSRGDDEFQWAARQAIIEQLYRQPIKMMGTPEAVFRDKGDGNAADTQAIIAKLMQQRISSVISELIEPNAKTNSTKQEWFKQAKVEAAKTDSRAAHITLVRPDPTMQQAVVEAYLIGRMPDGSWRVVWKTQHSVVPDKDTDLEDQIREDEQVKSIVDALGGLGQQDAVNKAIRFGAATMKGQRQAEDAYVKWRDAYFDTLTGPGIRLP